MGGHGNRNMYYLTGLPGWMRYGVSPGWVGRSSTGLGPTASYLTTGQWPTPQAQAYWQAMQAGQAPYPAFSGVGAAPYSYPPTGATPSGYSPFMGASPGAVPFGAQPDPEQELNFLKNQAEALKNQIEQINTRIKELEKPKESKQ